MSVTVEVFEFVRGSIELVDPGIRVDDVAVTDYELQVVAIGQPPVVDAGWSAPDTAGEDTGYLVGELDPGWWDLYTKYDSDPETPIKLVARIHIT